MIASLALMSYHPAQASTEHAREAVQKAEALVAKGYYQRAAQLVSEVDCHDDSACLTLVDFTYGWIYATWADVEPAKASDLRRRALFYYRQAREQSPANIQILYTLARTARRAGAPAHGRATSRHPARPPSLSRRDKTSSSSATFTSRLAREPARSRPTGPRPGPALTWPPRS